MSGQLNIQEQGEGCNNKNQLTRIINEICQQLKAGDKDLNYMIRDYSFKLMRLHGVDEDLYLNVFMEFIYFLNSNNKLKEIANDIANCEWKNLMKVLIKAISCLNLERETKENQTTKNSLTNASIGD